MGKGQIPNRAKIEEYAISVATDMVLFKEYKFSIDSMMIR